MPLEPTPSFSTARKWSISLNTLVSSLTVLALVLMVNYLAARHFTRLYVSKGAQLQLSPLTLQVLASLTNDVEVIVYFDKQDPLYDSVWGLLKEYSLRNNRIKLRTVDYERDPGTAISLGIRMRHVRHPARHLPVIDQPDKLGELILAK